LKLVVAATAKKDIESKEEETTDESTTVEK